MSSFFFDEDTPRTALMPVLVQLDKDGIGVPQTRDATPLDPFSQRRDDL